MHSTTPEPAGDEAAPAAPVGEPRERGQRGAKRQWRLALLPTIAAAIALVGLLVVMYPTASSWISQYNQSKIVVSENSGVDAMTATQREKDLAAADAYNASLKSGAIYQALTNQPASDAGKDLHATYNQLLNSNGSGLMGRIQIPSISLDLPIYHGTSDETLLEGIGHLEGTSLPVGGDGTHAVLTGHRGLANATMFTYLNEVKVGDQFTVTVLGRVLTYQVVNTKVVDPDQTESLLPVAGKDLVTLVTCTPLGINTQRIFVTGERVLPTPIEAQEAAEKAPTIPTFPWWIIVLVVGFTTVGVYVWRSGYPAHARTSTRKRARIKE